MIRIVIIGFPGATRIQGTLALTHYPCSTEHGLHEAPIAQSALADAKRAVVPNIYIYIYIDRERERERDICNVLVIMFNICV